MRDLTATDRIESVFDYMHEKRTVTMFNACSAQNPQNIFSYFFAFC